MGEWNQSLRRITYSGNKPVPSKHAIVAPRAQVGSGLLLFAGVPRYIIVHSAVPGPFSMQELALNLSTRAWHRHHPEGDVAEVPWGVP